MKNKIALILILVFAVLQLFTPEKIEEKIDSSLDFLENTEVDEALALKIKNTCYDCHSNKPKYPWYAEVAPVSFWIHDHIEEGREHLNFSEWGSYSAEKKAHKLEECYEEIEEDEMPLYSYTILHGDAQFSDEEKEELIAFFKKQEKNFKH